MGKPELSYSDFVTNCVQRTKGNNYPQHKKNLERVETLAEIVRDLKLIKQAGDRLDNYKKHIFYNTPEPKKTTEDIKIFKTSDDTQLAKQIDLIHAMLGIVTEVCGELSPILEGMLKNPDSIDEVNLFEELGDASGWYTALGLSALGRTYGESLLRIHEKLLVRYPTGFTSENAVNRNLEAERKALENTEAAVEVSKIVETSKNVGIINIEVKDSSQISHMVYKSAEKVLTVTFKTKPSKVESATPVRPPVYDYFNVDFGVVSELLQGESIGSTFAKVIKKNPDKYPFVQHVEHPFAGT